MPRSPPPARSTTGCRRSGSTCSVAWRCFRRSAGGLASALVAASDDAARAAGARVCKLHAQEYVRDLYAKLGYGQISDVDYEDEGQPHLWMAKLL